MRGEVWAGRPVGVGRRQRTSGMHGERARLCEGWGVYGMRGAHVEHVAHVRDAGRIPAGNVRVEVLQVIEELAHVGDPRDVPVGDGAVRHNGGCRVSVDRLDCRLQGGLAREGVGRRRR